MLRTLLVLPDGREIFSGKAGTAVVSARLRRNMNEAENVEPGTVCPDLLECTLAEGEALNLQPGQALTLYYVDDDGAQHQQGVFLVQTVRYTPKGLVLTAKDRLVLLEQDVTELVQQEGFWPRTVEELITAICDRCGLEAELSVMHMKQMVLGGCSSKRCTGTQLFSWLAQLLGYFCRADKNGRLTFSWFSINNFALSPTDTFVRVADGGMEILKECGAYTVDTKLVFSGMNPRMENGRLKLRINKECVSQYRVDGTLDVEGFQTAKVEQVRLKTDDEDPGVCYPQTATAANIYVLQGNPLLEGLDLAQRESLAQRLYERLQMPVYAPGILRVNADPRIRAGIIYQRRGSQQADSSFYAMQQVIEGAQMELRCTGTMIRGSDMVLPSGI